MIKGTITGPLIYSLVPGWHSWLVISETACVCMLLDLRQWVQGMQKKKIVALQGTMESLVDGMTEAIESGDDVTKELTASLVLLKAQLQALKQVAGELTPAPVDYSNLMHELNNMPPVMGVEASSPSIVR